MHKTFRSAVAIAALAALVPWASATVLTFDDIPQDGLVPASYGGIDWSAAGWSAFGEAQYPYTAHSGDWRVGTAFGSSDPESLIRFDMPTVFEGAWFSGYGDAPVTFELFSGGALIATSSTLSLSDTPAFLASGYTGLVDALLVSSPLHGGYAMDDFTFTNVQAVPEPQTYALMLAGLGVVGLLVRRRRT